MSKHIRGSNGSKPDKHAKVDEFNPGSIWVLAIGSVLCTMLAALIYIFFG